MLDFNSKLNPLNVITNGKKTKKIVFCRGEDQVVVWDRIELPVITQQPQNVTVDTDETFTLTCKAEANHGTLKYNWCSTDSDQPVHTGSTYTGQYSAAGTHQFYCIVSNERGDTTSNTVTVTVKSRLHLLKPSKLTINSNLHKYGMTADRGTIDDHRPVIIDGHTIKQFYSSIRLVYSGDGGHGGHYNIYNTLMIIFSENLSRKPTIKYKNQVVNELHLRSNKKTLSSNEYQEGFDDHGILGDLIDDLSNEKWINFEIIF